MERLRLLPFCAASIAAVLAIASDSLANTFAVNLGDTQIESGVVTGPAGLTKSGGGTLVLANAGNDYTGLTTISNGSIVISDPGTLGTDSSAITVTGFNPTIGQVTNLRGFDGGSLVLNGLAGGMEFSRGLSLQGQGPTADRGAALISIGDNTITGSVATALPAFGTSIPTRLLSAHGTLTLAGPVNLRSTTSFGAFTEGGAASYRLTGPLSGAGSLIKQGGGTLFLNPSSATGFSGVIIVSSGGAGGQSSVRISTQNVLGTRTAAGGTAVLTLSGGILEVLMDAPSVLQGGSSPANVYVSTSSTLYVDKGVGGAATGGTATFGQLGIGPNSPVLSFRSRNGYGMTFGAATMTSVTTTGTRNASTFSNSLQGGLLTFVGDFWRSTETFSDSTFLVTGDGDTRIDGSIVDLGVSGTRTFMKSGQGTLTVTGTATNISGGFTIAGGTVATRRIESGLLGRNSGAFGRALNFGTGASNLVTLDYLGAAGSGAGETTQSTITLGHNANARILANQTGRGPSALVLDSFFSMGTGAKTLTLGGASTLDNEIRSGLWDGATGVLAVRKVGGGTWVLSSSNAYTGETTVTDGTLKLTPRLSTSTILNDSALLSFGVDDATQAAGGRVIFTGYSGAVTSEQVGVLNPTAGAGTIRVANSGAPTTLAIAGITPLTGSLGASVNFEAPTARDIVTLGGATGFVRGSVYFNGQDFAFAGAGNVLRAPLYGTDAGFVEAAGTLTTGAHNNLTAAATVAGGTFASLRFAGSQMLTLTGTAAIGAGVNTAGGVLIAGGNAVIAQGGGGALTVGAGDAALVIRTHQTTDTLALQVPITGSSTQGLTKTGAGILILSAANEQTGTTHIDEGTVRLAEGGRLSVAGQNLVIRQGGTLDLYGVTQDRDTISSLNGAGTVTNGHAIPAQLALGAQQGSGMFSGVIQDGLGRVSVLKQSTGTIHFTGANTYTGPTEISGGAFAVRSLTDIGVQGSLGRGDATSDASNAASLILSGSSLVSTPAALNYVGTEQTSTNRLFTLGGTGAGAGASLLANGVNNAGVVFTNPAPIAYTPAGATLAQHLVLAGASTADNRIDPRLVNSGSAGGSLRVSKQEGGKWVLGQAGNSYTGPTTIRGGVLEARDGQSLPTVSPLLFVGASSTPDGGVLETRGSFLRSLSAGTVAGTVNFNASGNFAGSGGFAASGDKLVVNLGGASASLEWGANGFLMPGSAAATFRLSSPTALGEVDFQNPIDLGNARRTVQVDDNTNTGADFARISGVLSGGPGAGLLKTGSGILVLAGANTYSGTTTVGAGSLVVRSLGDSSVPAGSSVGHSGQANTDFGAVLLGDGATGSAILQYVGAGETSDRKIRLNTNSQIAADGSGPLILRNVANDVSTGSRTLTLRGTNAAGNRIDSVLTDSPIGSGTAARPLSVSVSGAATWILNAGNQHTGSTTSEGGALGLGHDRALGGGRLRLSGGNVFAYGGDRTIANPVSADVSVIQGFLGNHSLTFTQPLAFDSSTTLTPPLGLNNNLAAGEALTFGGFNTLRQVVGQTFTVDGPGLTIFSGPIANTTALSLSLSKTGTGTLVLRSNGSDFTRIGGNLDIDNGTVRIEATDAIPSGPGFGGVNFSPDNGQNETPVLNLNGFSQTLSRLTATNSSASTIDNASGSAVTLTVGANDGAVNYNGALTNSGGGALSIVKTGTAAGTFSGAQLSYTGATTVEGGGLLHFARSDPTATRSISVAAGAGISFINGTGSSFSGLTALNLGAGGGVTSLGLDVGTSSDLLTIPGTAATAGTVNLSIGAAPGLGGASSYTLLSAAGGLSGATYAVRGVAAGGFTYSLSPSDTAVVLNVTATGGGTHFWRGELGGSWNTYLAGDTNWLTAAGIDPQFNPGALNTVVFSASDNPPAGATISTTLDLPVTIEHLQFNGVNASTAAARVSIGPGMGLNTLTLAPGLPTLGIEIAASGGTASITAPLVLAADQTWAVSSVGALRPELIVPGILSGPGDLTKTGAGTATITGNNVRTGRTAIIGGTLVINAEVALGVNPTTPTADQLFFDGGILRITQSLVINDSNRGVTLGPLGGTFDTTVGNTVGSLTVATPIVGTGGLRKEGVGTVILSAANAYEGGTFINRGTVRVAHNAALGSSQVALVNSATVLELADGVNLPNAVSVLDSGSDKAIRLLAGSTSATLSGDVSVGAITPGDFRAQAGAGGTLIFAGNLLQSGTASPGLRVNEVTGNIGTVVLAGANTYGGVTEVRQGTLRNGADEVIPGALAMNAFASGTAPATATFDIAMHSETLSALTFGAAGSSNAGHFNLVTGAAGTLTLGGTVTTIAGHPEARAELRANLALPGTVSFTIANASAQPVDLLVASAIIGPGGIVKAGPGTMEMSGTTTYAGNTEVSGGTLLVTGLISGAVTTTGGTLGGTGRVGAIEASAGTIAPGSSIGTFTASSLTMSGSATFQLEIDTTNATNDLLNTSGPLTLSLGGTPLSLTDLGGNFALADGVRFSFLTYTGGRTGFFSVGGNVIADDVGYFNLGANTFALDYDDLGGTAVSLVVVPEVGVAESLVGGVALLAGRRRPRRGPKAARKGAR